MTLTEKRDIIQAAIDGKKIERKSKRNVLPFQENWEWKLLPKHKDENAFNFYVYDYRVRPAPLFKIAGHDVYRTEAGLRVGCTEVTRKEVQEAYYSL